LLQKGDALACFSDLLSQAFLRYQLRPEGEQVEEQNEADQPPDQGEDALTLPERIEPGSELLPLLLHCGRSTVLTASLVARWNSRKRGGVAAFFSPAGSAGRFISKRAKLRPASTSSRLRR
jgi:hypothetical protein